jgi:peptidoglycan/LPS O-acetylase OafA/YrhL
VATAVRAPANRLETARSGRRRTPRKQAFKTPNRASFHHLPSGKGVVRTRSGYLPGLDGLRALAVIAVLIYHARPAWLPGGFLGVEVFFVISGFIITRGLLTEWETTGRIAVRAFWLRRARRLLPAVLLLIAVTLAYAALFQADQLSNLRGDALAALLYVTNWHQIIAHQSYFDSFARPSMLRHLWSLGVEEQFYFIWPLLLMLGMPILKRGVLLGLIVAGIVASALGMALLYDPAGDASRVYYGTDTRAAALLTGAALAFIVSGWHLAESRRLVPRTLALIGFAALALVLGAALWLDESQPLLYRGGFLAVSLTSAIVILAATQPNTFTKLLSVTPLRWLGVRSYGIYLWHWPIYMLIWPNEPTLGELAAQITAVILMAAASYQLVEKPVREGALGRLYEKVRSWPSLSLRVRGGLVFSGASTAAILFGLIAVTLQAQPPQVPPYFETKSIRLQNIVVDDASSVLLRETMMGKVQSALSSLTSEPRACPYNFESPNPNLGSVSSAPYGPECPQPVALFRAPDSAQIAQAKRLVPQATDLPAAGQMAMAVPPPDLKKPDPPQKEESSISTSTKTASNPAPVQSSPPPTLTSAPSVSAIGDSVMLGAAYTLAGSIPGIDLDAAVGRQASAAVSLLQERAASGTLGQVLVVHIGNNGTLTSGQIDQIMQIAGPSRRVIFLTLHVPRSWQDSNNAVLAGVTRYANATLIDWYSVGEQHPEFLYTDGIHLTPAGANYYASLVVGAIGR